MIVCHQCGAECGADYPFPCSRGCDAVYLWTLRSLPTGVDPRERYRAAHRAAGLCELCRRPLATQRLCREHADKAATRKRRWQLGRTMRALAKRSAAGRGLNVLCVVLALLGVSGCAHLTSPASIRDIGGGLMWAQFRADRRGAVILPEGQRRVICAEPSPDVAMEETAKLLLTGEYAGATVSMSPELAARVVELAGRTQTVLVLREITYRACEQAAADNLTSADIRAIYTDALATVRAMTEADKARSVEGAARALDLLDTETRRLLNAIADPNGATP